MGRFPPHCEFQGHLQGRSPASGCGVWGKHSWCLFRFPVIHPMLLSASCPSYTHSNQPCEAGTMRSDYRTSLLPALLGAAGPKAPWVVEVPLLLFLGYCPLPCTRRPFHTLQICLHISPPPFTMWDPLPKICCRRHHLLKSYPALRTIPPFPLPDFNPRQEDTRRRHLAYTPTCAHTHSHSR